jgi:hypothetical protein
MELDLKTRAALQLAQTNMAVSLAQAGAQRK